MTWSIMSESKLTIVANIHAKAEEIDRVKSGLLKLIDITRAEKGCIGYDLHQDHENPAHFLFFENWESRELWQVHMANKHVTDFLESTEDAIEDVSIHEMSQIG